jgi:hypothetical protein
MMDKELLQMLIAQRQLQDGIAVMPCEDMTVEQFQDLYPSAEQD